MAGKADLRVTIDAETARFERAMERAQRSTQRLETQLRSADVTAAQLDRMLEEQRAEAMRRTGQAMFAMGAAIMGGLALATKAAIDWESAWAGVLKVIDGSPEEIARLESELRGLATTLPFAHEEVAQVAQAAGQLGIATNDIAEFTETMLALGVATDMTAEEAAFSLARLSTIMQTATSDVDRMGATIVDLGNNAAATEREIVEMGLRIAGAGQVIGFSEADVLAFASALASVGIEAQAGGTAISRVMVNIANSVATGGEAVQGFADVAGMSADEFVRAFEDDPARAIASFVEGLGRINESGGNVFATLQDLGMGEIRVRDALLRMSGAGDLLSESLDRAATAWDENTALIEEAERRYDTAESKIQVAKNTLVDLAIDVGSVLLPALVKLVETGADIVRFFADLPGPVKAAVTVMAALLGGVTLLSGAFLLLAPRIAAARALMLQWGAANRVAFGAMIAAGQLAGLAAGFAAVAVAMQLIHEASIEAAASVADMTEGLLRLREGETTAAIDTLIEKRDRLADRSLWGDISRSIFGLGASMHELRHDADELSAEIESVDQALTGLVQSGHADIAAEAVQRLGERMGLSGDELDRWVRARLPGYLDALQQIENEHAIAAESIDPLEQGLEELAVRFGLTGDDAVKAAEQMLKAWADANVEFVDILGAYKNVLSEKEAAERKTAEATAAATGSTTDSWEDYVGDVSVSVDEYLDELERMVAAQQEWQANMLILSARVSAGTLDQLARLGPEGAPLVAQLVDASDEELARLEQVFAFQSQAAGDAFAQTLAASQPELQRIGRELGEDTVAKLVEYMLKHGVDVEQAAKALGVKIDKGVRDGEDRKIPVVLTGLGQLTDGVNKIENLLDGLPSRKDIAISVFTGRTPTFGHTAREQGGPVSAGQTYLVGERGPELFTPAVSGGITPNHALPQGGPLSRINVKVDSDRMRGSTFVDVANAAARAVGQASAANAGKVLPRGSYRIGRGPAGHGYNARDLPAPTGTPIYAPASGVVTQAARLAYSYGVHARIAHPGNWRTLYAHMSQMYVRAGQGVHRGQMIGRVGSTGNSTGPHLHLEPDLPRLYDRGGKWQTGTVGINNSGGTEYVLSPQQSRMFDRMIGAMEAGARGGDGAALEIRVTGNGPLYEQIQHGLRSGSLKMTAGGTPVRAG